MKDLNVRELALPIRQRALTMAFSPELITREPALVEDSLIRAWTATLRAHIPYNTLLRYMKPRTWWDAVKERWLPAWFVSRFGIEIEYDHILIEELLNVALPKGLGDRYYTLYFNGKEESLPPDAVEQATITCPKCKTSIFLPAERVSFCDRTRS